MTENERFRILNAAVRQFTALREFMESEKEFLDLINKGEEKTWKSLISKFFFRSAVTFGKSGFNLAKRNESNADYIKKATELLNDPSFQHHFCCKVRVAEQMEQETDEWLVTLVFEALMDTLEGVTEQHQIDSRLIANVSIELQKLGVNVYCGIS